MRILINVIVGIICLGMCELSYAFPGRYESLPPQEIEPFQFFDEQGQEHSLKEFEGKIVILNYWSTRCPPCLAEMPSLDRLAGQFDDVVVLPLCRDQKSPEPVTQIYDSMDLKHLKIWLDVERSGPKVFQSKATPTTLIINREGKLVGRYIGSTGWDDPEMIGLIQLYREGKLPDPEKSAWQKIKDFFKHTLKI